MGRPRPRDRQPPGLADNLRAMLETRPNFRSSPRPRRPRDTPTPRSWAWEARRWARRSCVSRLETTTAWSCRCWTRQTPERCSARDALPLEQTVFIVASKSWHDRDLSHLSTSTRPRQQPPSSSSRSPTRAPGLHVAEERASRGVPERPKSAAATRRSRSSGWSRRRSPAWTSTCCTPPAEAEENCAAYDCARSNSGLWLGIALGDLRYRAATRSPSCSTADLQLGRGWSS